MIENISTNNVDSPTRLLRRVENNDVILTTTPNVEVNENRRRSSTTSSSKNVRRLTLTMASLNVTNGEVDDDAKLHNDVFDDDATNVDNKSTSTTLIEICREKESLVNDILQMICDLRDSQLVAMSYRVRQRAVASKYSAYVMKDFPSLYGRCFNLSMNLKILTQCQHGDSSIAARVLSDFDILEKSLEAKMPPRSTDLSAMLENIQI